MEFDSSRLLFLIIVLLFFLSTPSGDGVTSQYEFVQLQTLKSQIKYELERFQEQKYNTNFQNITGLKLSYGDSVANPEQNATFPLPAKNYDSWESTEEYMILPQELITDVESHIWQSSPSIYPANITSNLHGKVKVLENQKYRKIRMPIPNFYEPPTSFQDELPPEGEHYLRVDDFGNADNGGEIHNVTWENGRIDISIQNLDKMVNKVEASQHSEDGNVMFNSQSDKWKMLHVSLDLYDKDESEKHSISARGIYDVKTGRILVMSQSAKFHSFFAFPHYFANSEDEYNQLKELLSIYANSTNLVNALTMRTLNHWKDEAAFKCEYLGFIQLESWDQYTPDQLKMIDDELQWPLGRPINLSSLPPIQIKDGLLYSPDCGVSMGLEDVKGPRYELEVRKMRIHLLAGVLLFLGQIYLLLCQMNHTNTPSSVNKISYWCLFMMNLVDGCLAMLYFIASSVLQELYLPLCVSAFACFILASIFEIRYMISVYASQVNEQGVGIITLLRGGTEQNNIINRVMPDESAISSSLYGRFFFTLIVSMFAVLSIFSASKGVRNVFEYASLFILNSYWIPQIYRNAVKGSEPLRRRNRGYTSLQTPDSNPIPLLWSFTLGTSVIRLVPIVYVFTYPSNVFRHHTDIRFAVLLSLWMLLQLIVLYSQHILGSRWFLPQHVIPDGYLYHRPVSKALLMEHGAQGNLVSCAICMGDVPVYVEEDEETHKVDLQSYMLTPCSHIFHTECLENWMSYKLQCPVCRAALPPL